MLTFSRARDPAFAERFGTRFHRRQDEDLPATPGSKRKVSIG